jgi:hypothetical protein
LTVLPETPREKVSVREAARAWGLDVETARARAEHLCIYDAIHDAVDLRLVKARLAELLAAAQPLRQHLVRAGLLPHEDGTVARRTTA